MHDTRRLVEDAQRVEPKPRLRDWLWAPILIAAAILSGLVTAPHAKADGYLSTGEADYVNNYGYIICDTIATRPTAAGVLGVVKGVMTTGGFTADNAVDVVNASVQGQCDEWWPLLQRIGRQARGEMTV
ncbi:hypothetical protein A5668_09045 [Mycolicibacterium fortuitum]|uniref:hypothetical protein n=1 Tax=Mycolicibacterium fortuitum TaxID=1766 RepID=UPI0007EA8D6F|nr:hypothetical protein [Mycolicibacterium fortuitum]OBA94639.1 hypothetical protein A5668_09045 [Mycolicibacterium fortuitum]